jgi:predicted transcriptional regulator of viral defense system
MKYEQTLTSELAVLQMAQERGLLRARDLQEKGLPTISLTRLVLAGKLERVARGLYAIPNQSVSEHRSLAEAAIRIPRGVICLLSALRIHDIGTQAPFDVWMTLPSHMLTPRIDQPRLRIVRMSGKSLVEGVEERIFDGVTIRVFTLAKTIADCFKFRNKIGLDVALEALRDGWQKNAISMDEVWHYAKINRVANVMRPYLEAITA